MDDDFIVDDEGFGYKDHGGEIWDNQSDDEYGQNGADKKKKRKLVQGEQTINQFMFNASMKPKKPTAQAKKPVNAVNELESRNIMNNLFQDLDANEDQLVENATLQKQPQQVAYNK